MQRKWTEVDNEFLDDNATEISEVVWLSRMASEIGLSVMLVENIDTWWNRYLKSCRKLNKSAKYEVFRAYWNELNTTYHNVQNVGEPAKYAASVVANKLMIENYKRIFNIKAEGQLAIVCAYEFNSFPELSLNKPKKAESSEPLILTPSPKRARSKSGKLMIEAEQQLIYLVETALSSDSNSNEESAESNSVSTRAKRFHASDKSIQQLIRTIIPSSPERLVISNEITGNGESECDTDSDDDIFSDADVETFTLPFDCANPFEVHSRWKLKNSTLLSTQLFNNALEISQEVRAGNKTLTAEERYAVTLSLSCVWDPTSATQKTLLGVDQDEYEELCRAANDCWSVELEEPAALKDMEVVKILRYCANQSFHKARYAAKAYVSKKLENLDDVDDANADDYWNTLIILQILEFILDFFSFDPSIMMTVEGEKAPSESEYVDYVSGILKIALQNVCRIRKGELQAEMTKRRKVDLILTQDKNQISHSEFARYASMGSAKFWRDRSKVIRLNQQITNNFGSDTAFLQISRINANLLLLRHVDDNLYLVNTKESFSFPHCKEDIARKFTEMISAIFYFKVWNLFVGYMFNTSCRIE
ncbi:hypothetical protein HK096_003734 [Nowakowskiella sp. JEL0078]|nr:hypothetical protein HK096_003734 [Nowakowskiella sp. JEL0078]